MLDEMKELNQWILWKYITKQGEVKPVKLPLSPLTGKAVSTSLSKNSGAYVDWTNFDFADKRKSFFQSNGLGFVLTSTDPYVCVDIDDCVSNDGSLSEYARKCVEKLASYSEISPSGKGIRIICSTREALQNVRTQAIEIYYADRYCTYTGNVILDVILDVPIRDCTEELKKAVEQLSKPKVVIDTQVKPITKSSSRDTKAIWEKIHNCKSQYTRDLFNGITGFNNPNRSEADYSNRDLALARTLSYFCNGNSQLVRQMMLESGLQRDKWYTKWSDSTYYDWLDYIVTSGVNQYLEKKS